MGGGRLQPVLCHRAGAETGGLDPEELRESEELGLDYLLPWSEWSAGSQGVLLELGAGIKH